MHQGDSVLICSECQAALPDVRRRTPWCECGWSALADEQLKIALAAPRSSRLERDLKRARRLAEMDARVLRMLERPLGRLLWRLYTYLTVLLCVPILLLRLIFTVALLAIFAFFLFNSPRGVTIFIGTIIGIFLFFPRLVRSSRGKHVSIPLTPQQAPQLFEVIDQVAARLQVPPFERVFLSLDANASAGLSMRWQPFPRWERRLNLGLLAFNALTMTQFRAMLAHEMAHFRNRDTWLGFLFGYAVRSLDDLDETLWLLFGLGLPVQVIFFVYRRFLTWVGLWAMRRHEYSADRIAAIAYGRLAVFQWLIRAPAMHIGFKEYLPEMLQRIGTGVDRHDLYYQFLQHWDALRPEERQAAYSQAVASWRSVDHTHPTYQDRYRALEHVQEPDEQDDSSPSALLPNAHELGRELTIKSIRRIVPRKK